MQYCRDNKYNKTSFGLVLARIIDKELTYHIQSRIKYNTVGHPLTFLLRYIYYDGQQQQYQEEAE